jgi:hypothetical protein
VGELASKYINYYGNSGCNYYDQSANYKKLCPMKDTTQHRITTEMVEALLTKLSLDLWQLLVPVQDHNGNAGSAGQSIMMFLALIAAECKLWWKWSWCYL